IILTLSRGGPTTPILVRGDEMIIDANYLLDIQNQGLHASSDCFEDALTARVPTLGCRRCGGGMSGKTMVSLIEKGARMAEKYKFAGSIILEGSGASVPEIKTDKVVLLMDITQPKDILEGYLTPLKVSYADLIVLTMCEDFLVSQAKINQLIKKIRLINPKAQIATTVLRPFPLQSIKGKKVFWTTTAQSKSVPFLKKYIEETYGCSIVGMSAYLSNQPKLKKDMAKSPRFDLVITELKAAAISVVAREAVKQGKGVVFLDNMITLIPKGGNVKNLKKEVIKLISSNPK
ncbi:2,3-diphosphoglycerate synthetase, partial [Patescibacteria group bacterium]|nr:2,3-diphosphoglycerate synthetase [Patescibacteria group bacterium]